ncbi:MAG: hypothetical protein K0S74_84 [Chlamydiales bacterium]|jgi:tetratricopeptide (TPR) repeat protein|nr:hypothetical protein [Chlamydiales bacterium]
MLSSLYTATTQDISIRVDEILKDISTNSNLDLESKFEQLNFFLNYPTYSTVAWKLVIAAALKEENLDKIRAFVMLLEKVSLLRINLLLRIDLLEIKVKLWKSTISYDQYIGLITSEIKFWEDLALRQPTKAKVYFIRLKSHFENKQYDLALVDCDVVSQSTLKDDKENAAVYKALIYKEKKQYNQAIKQIDKILKNSPSLDKELYAEKLKQECIEAWQSEIFEVEMDEKEPLAAIDRTPTINNLNLKRPIPSSEDDKLSLKYIRPEKP